MIMKVATKTFDGLVLRVGFSLFFVLVSFSACKEKKKEKIPSDVKGVPIHPRTKSMRVVKDEKNHLEIQLSVNHSPLQTIVYYRKKLVSMGFDLVEDLQRANTAKLVGIRGLEHLQVEFKKTGGSVEVKLLKRQLKEDAKVFKGPPMPEDIPLPKEIRWDGRVFAASGDDVELRGRCGCSLEKAKSLLKAAIEEKGWQPEVGEKGELSAKKEDRKLRVFFKSKGDSSTNVRVVMDASEFTRERGGDEQGDEEKKGREEDKEMGKSEALTRPRTRDTPEKISWPPELRVKLPGDWRDLSSEPDPLVNIQRGFYTERKDMDALVGEVRKVLRQKGWKPMDVPKGLGLSADEGRFLLFTKGGKTISAQMSSSSDGVQLVLSLSGE